MSPPQSFSAGSQSPPTNVVRHPSTPAEKLRFLEQERHRVHREFARLDHNLALGTITDEEYDYYLKKVYRGRQEHEVMQYLYKQERQVKGTIEPRAEPTSHKSILFAFLFVLLAGFALVLLFGPQDAPITGYIVAPVRPVTNAVDATFTESGEYLLNVTDTTMVALTGSLRGSATVHLLVDQERYFVYEGATDPYAVWTDKESYARNGTVNVTVTPADAAYTLWLENEAGQRIVVPKTFHLDEAGSFTLDALINDSGNVTIVSTNFTVRNDTNESRDVERTTFGDTLSLEEECAETCEMNNTGNRTVTLDIELEDGSELTIHEIVITQERENQPPVQVIDIPAVSLEVGETVELDLAPFFVDVDDEALTYDFMDASGVDMSVDGSTLTLTGTAAGSDEALIYASDLYELVQSNTFTITVTGTTTPPPGINETSNVTEENVTEPVGKENKTLKDLPPGLCNHPDVNKRPVECLQEDYRKYFRPQPVKITDAGRKTIATLSPIGNLKIKGEVFEQATFEYDNKDYHIGYMDDYGDYHATVWFDSKTGNLYLTGNLYEENINNVPDKNSFGLSNQAGVVLAWADKYAGDLYLRGAVLTGRGDVE